MDFQFLFQLGLSIFDSALAAIFFLKLNGYKWKEKPFFCILFFILLFIAIFINSEFSVFAIILSISVSFIMQLLCFRKESWVKYFLISLLYFASLIFINSIVFNIVRLILNQSISEIMLRMEIYVSICLISKSCLLFLVKLIIIIEESLDDHRESSNKNLIPLLSITIYNIILFIFLMFSSLDKAFLDSSVIIIFSMISIFLGEIANYVMYFAMQRKAAVELELEMLKQQKNYDQKIFEEKQVSSENIAKLNHDIKGHLMYIVYNIDKKSYDTAKNYIMDIWGHVDNSAYFVSITNDIINFIINFKADIAKKKGVDIECHIEDIKDCNVEGFDLCVLLNNMLDNALEAVEHVQEKKVSIEIYHYSGYLVFSVKSTIENSVLNKNKKLISSKKDKLNHGYGIKQIQSIAEKYQGCMDIYEMENKFCMNVFISHEK